MLSSVLFQYFYSLIFYIYNFIFFKLRSLIYQKVVQSVKQRCFFSGGSASQPSLCPDLRNHINHTMNSHVVSQIYYYSFFFILLICPFLSHHHSVFIIVDLVLSHFYPHFKKFILFYSFILPAQPQNQCVKLGF